MGNNQRKDSDISDHISKGSWNIQCRFYLVLHKDYIKQVSTEIAFALCQLSVLDYSWQVTYPTGVENYNMIIWPWTLPKGSI